MVESMLKRTIEWKENKVIIIDQRKLPDRFELLTCTTYEEIIDAIQNMAIRGAPAIGIAGAYGMALAAISIKTTDKSLFMNKLKEVKKELANSRPTAINLFWALDEVWRLIVDIDESINNIKERIISKVESLAEQDIRTNYLIGENGLNFFEDGDSILTHCNAGSLATVFYGTALGVIRSVYEKKKNIKIFVDETRPVLQGARLTAWELSESKIPHTLICDSMAGFLMYQRKINKVIVGADRIAANGDIANKIGTYSLSVLAKTHNIPFYVAAPISTFDIKMKNGNSIPIEERNPREITHFSGKMIAPNNSMVYNPAFDITPHENISAIITEKGAIKPPYGKSISSLIQNMKRTGEKIAKP